MYRTTLSIILIMLITFPALAGNKNHPARVASTQAVKGVIQDQETREKLTGVAIVIESLDQKIYTDADGSFVIPSLQPGTYTLTFQCISYKDKKVTVDIQTMKKGKLNVGLEPVNP